MTKHRQNHPSMHAKYGLKHGKFAVFSLGNDKRHTSAVRYKTFFSPLNADKWHGIRIPLPKLEGNGRMLLSLYKLIRQPVLRKTYRISWRLKPLDITGEPKPDHSSLMANRSPSGTSAWQQPTSCAWWQTR